MKWLALLSATVGLVLLGAGPAAAEPGGLRISDLRISVWPEYDEPRVLVMYEGKLGPGISLPQKISFRVPRGSEISETCGLKKPNDEHLCQLYETAAEGDWTVVSYEVPVPDFFVQIYYNPVSGAGQRAFDFGFAPTYPVDNLQLEIQQPARSSDFALTPTTQNTAADQQGLKYYRYDFKDLPVDKVVGAKITYTKADARPSVNKPPEQQAGATSSAVSDASRFTWIIVAVAMVGAIALVLVRQRLRVRPEPGSAMVWQTAGPGSGSGTATRESPRPRAFCTHCGHRLRPGDHFCAECGVRTGDAQ